MDFYKNLAKKLLIFDLTRAQYLPKIKTGLASRKTCEHYP